MVVRLRGRGGEAQGTWGCGGGGEAQGLWCLGVHHFRSAQMVQHLKMLPRQMLDEQYKNTNMQNLLDFESTLFSSLVSVELQYFTPPFPVGTSISLSTLLPAVDEELIDEEALLDPTARQLMEQNRSPPSSKPCPSR